MFALVQALRRRVAELEALTSSGGVPAAPRADQSSQTDPSKGAEEAGWHAAAFFHGCAVIYI